MFQPARAKTGWSDPKQIHERALCDIVALLTSSTANVDPHKRLVGVGAFHFAKLCSAEPAKLEQ